MSDVIRIIIAMAMYAKEILILPIFIYFIAIILLFCFITKETKKIILADLLWGILFFFATFIFFAYEIHSWGSLSGDSGMIVVVLLVFHFIVNSIFLFIQGLITRSANNQKNRKKMLKQKEICFLIHIILLFGLYLFMEISRNISYIEDFTWVFYIVVFATFSYLLYDHIFNKNCLSTISNLIDY